MTTEKLLMVLEKITDIYNKLYGDENTTPFETYVYLFSDGSGRVVLDCDNSKSRQLSKLKYFDNESVLFDFNNLEDFQIKVLDWSISLALNMKVF